MSVQYAVEADHVAAGYGSALVWSQANLRVHAGSFAAVVGPNGAGKSTLFKLLLGLVPPAAGELRVFGRRPLRGDVATGYMPQSHPHETAVPFVGRDLVALGADGHRWGIPLGHSKGRAKWRDVDEAVAAVGAAAYASRPLAELSGGEQQRLHLAQALVGRPRLLLLDEPLSHLDVRNQTVMAELVERLRRERSLTVLVIVHDINPLLPFVDSVIYVSQGRVSSGDPKTVISSERLSEIYGAHVEVLRDSRGRVFVVGLEEEVAHPHPPLAGDDGTR